MVTWEEHTKQSRFCRWFNAQVGLWHLSTATSVQQMCFWSLSTGTIVKHYLCSEWGWCYVIEGQKVEKAKHQEIDECHFSFFKAPFRVPGLSLELNWISLHRPSSQYTVPRYLGGPSVAQICRCSSLLYKILYTAWLPFLWVLHPWVWRADCSFFFRSWDFWAKCRGGWTECLS